MIFNLQNTLMHLHVDKTLSRLRSIGRDRRGSSGVGCCNSELTLEVPDHEAGAGVDERCHRLVRKHLGMVQHRVVRQRLDRGDTYE